MAQELDITDKGATGESGTENVRKDSLQYGMAYLCYMYVHVCVPLCACVSLRVFVYMCVQMCADVWMYVCVCKSTLCIYVIIYCTFGCIICMPMQYVCMYVCVCYMGVDEVGDTPYPHSVALRPKDVFGSNVVT